MINMPWVYKSGPKGKGWYFGSTFHGNISKEKRKKVAAAYYSQKGKK